MNESNDENKRTRTPRPVLAVSNAQAFDELDGESDMWHMFDSISEAKDFVEKNCKVDSTDEESGEIPLKNVSGGYVRLYRTTVVAPKVTTSVKFL